MNKTFGVRSVSPQSHVWRPEYSGQLVPPRNKLYWWWGNQKTARIPVGSSSYLHTVFYCKDRMEDMASFLETSALSVNPSPLDKGLCS